MKIERNASYLGRILPNIFEPGYRVRKLYVGVLNSMAMYGVPVWAKYIARKEVAMLSMQRLIALRVARASRTTPSDMLFALPSTLPYKWQAKA